MMLLQDKEKADRYWSAFFSVSHEQDFLCLIPNNVLINPASQRSHIAVIDETSLFLKFLYECILTASRREQEIIKYSLLCALISPEAT